MALIWEASMPHSSWTHSIQMVVSQINLCCSSVGFRNSLTSLLESIESIGFPYTRHLNWPQQYIKLGSAHIVLLYSLVVKTPHNREKRYGILFLEASVIPVLFGWALNTHMGKIPPILVSSLVGNVPLTVCFWFFYSVWYYSYKNRCKRVFGIPDRDVTEPQTNIRSPLSCDRNRPKALEEYLKCASHIGGCTLQLTISRHQFS